MRIFISPTATFDLDVPDDMNTTDVNVFLDFQASRPSDLVRRHTLTEANQCQMYQAVLKGFANNQFTLFQNLSSFTLDIGLHAPSLLAPIDPFYRCGLTFRMKILLGCEPFTNPAQPMQGNQSTYMDGPIEKYEPRRRMLAPLIVLQNVRDVEISREWIIHHRIPEGPEEGVKRAMGLRAHYDSVGSFLDDVGEDFKNIQCPGLKASNIKAENLIELIESLPDEDDGFGNDRHILRADSSQKVTEVGDGSLARKLSEAFHGWEAPQRTSKRG